MHRLTCTERQPSLSLRGLATERQSGDELSAVRELIHICYKSNSFSVLIEGGADLNIQDEDGHTALFWAQEFNYKRIVKQLKKNGATL